MQKLAGWGMSDWDVGVKVIRQTYSIRNQCASCRRITHVCLSHSSTKIAAFGCAGVQELD